MAHYDMIYKITDPVLVNMSVETMFTISKLLEAWLVDTSTWPNGHTKIVKTGRGELHITRQAGVDAKGQEYNKLQIEIA